MDAIGLLDALSFAGMPDEEKRKMIAESQALDHAAAQGYTVAVASVREDNLPSICLHEKLGFELDSPYTGRGGKTMRLYIKALTPKNYHENLLN